MPATPGAPGRRPQRRDQPREWSALDTPHGFERCVRATLRELYGYVALLAGRDRREAERIVSDVYRSLFRAVGAGQIESVTLGALRSAARRTWLAEHRLEIAVTDEVSRAPVTTIAELSPLERAVLVLQHVNGMSAERAAQEVGRTEREIAAVSAHAVRRLRGTDDTSGAWLRAYLGPSVSATAGLVDRIVHRLAEPDRVDETEHLVETDQTVDTEQADDQPDAEAGDEAGDEPGAEGAGAEAELDDGSERVDEVVPVEPIVEEPPETTELAVVERPTVELPTVVGEPHLVEVGDHGDPADAGPVEPDRAGSRDGSQDGSIDERRPRWALAIGAALLAGLVVALVWLALRGDPGDTVVSTPETLDHAAATFPDVTDPAATATTVARPDGSAPTSSAVPGVVELGFDPVCSERDGAESEQSATWDVTFGPLGAQPVLTVTFPESVDLTADPARAPSVASAVLRPDGMVVAVRPADDHGFDETILARIGLDGTVAWTRCAGERVLVGSAPGVGVDLAVRPVDEAGTTDGWMALSAADGSIGPSLDTEQSEALDTSGSSLDEDRDGPSLGFTYDSERGRSVLAGLDDGRVLWSAPEVVLPDDGFRTSAVGETALVQTCVAGDVAGENDGDVDAPAEQADVVDDGDCPAGELRGYDLVTGELLWSRAGVHAVVASGDGVALVGDGTVWELLDIRSAVVGDGQRWDDPATFDVGVEAGAGGVLREGGALVVVRPGSASVWLPADASTEHATVSVP